MLQNFAVFHHVDITDAVDENPEGILGVNVLAPHKLRFEGEIERNDQVVRDSQMAGLLDVLREWVVLGQHVK